MKMSGEVRFLCMIAVISFLFCIYNLVNLILIQNKSAKTTGTVISFTTAIPTENGFHNSKWAQVSYKVNGKNYISTNRIQVPFSSELGSTVEICYDKQQPEKIYSFTAARSLVSLGIMITCIIVIMFKLF